MSARVRRRDLRDPEVTPDGPAGLRISVRRVRAIAGTLAFAVLLLGAKVRTDLERSHAGPQAVMAVWTAFLVFLAWLVLWGFRTRTRLLEDRLEIRTVLGTRTLLLSEIGDLLVVKV